MDSTQQQQELQYGFPYHYIPARSDRRVATHLRWGWGLHYLAGIDMAIAQLAEHPPQSLLDVGCGDGRFARELRLAYPNTYVLGLDYSERAIALANALNPSMDFRCVDVTEWRPDEPLHAASLIEVIEHIPPASLHNFIAGTCQCLTSGAKVVVTVPHSNVPLQSKHYQHFSKASLCSVLDPHLSDITIVPFGAMPLHLRLIAKLMGLTSGPIIVDFPKVAEKVYRAYINRCRAGQDESQCTRLLAVGFCR